MPFSFYRLEIPDLVLIEPVVFGDERGFFLEFYKRSEFLKAGIKEDFVQDNHSCSLKGVLRGLHFQKEPEAQGKLLRCIRGEIFDVAVDIRKGSPTFGKWVSVILSEDNRRMLYIPAGFAHGFQVISERAEVIYKTTKEYSPEHEAGIIWNDPELNIDWPIKEPILSKRDKGWPFLRDLYQL
ncbi:MAG: dTDP-4-dehydrorhamnose 3,5-epimerase [Thermodesulfovibrionales bacterium]|nr:dTDP-4-dehydrorhamnose 3,5-epimerase [Thermodesulfovibrionales bacterium]